MDAGLFVTDLFQHATPTLTAEPKKTQPKPLPPQRHSSILPVGLLRAEVKQSCFISSELLLLFDFSGAVVKWTLHRSLQECILFVIKHINDHHILLGSIHVTSVTMYMYTQTKDQTHTHTHTAVTFLHFNHSPETM